MRVLRAEVLGMCFGVRDALRAIGRVEEPGRVTIHGELVHNERVLVELDTRGFRRSEERGRGIPETPRVLVTAHGISDAERARLLAAGKEILDTTCPLVTRVHRAAQALKEEGRFVVVIGKAGHVEVRGIVEDLDDFAVVVGVEDVKDWGRRRLGVVSQTTQPERKVAEIVEEVRRRNPGADLKVIDTVCLPTKEHQRALERLLDQVGAVVVVGGRNSNNTRQLTERCRERRVRVWQVQGSEDLRPEWFRGIDCVGLTAGTSTLDETIEGVEEALRRMGEGLEAGELAAGRA